MELKGSQLTLESKTRKSGTKTYNLQWTIRNFSPLRNNIFHLAPPVQIGKFVCEYKCAMKAVESSDDPLITCVYLGLVPCPTFATVTFTILSPDGGIQHSDENLMEFVPSLKREGRFFAFKVASDTDDLVAICTIETDLPDDGNFICKAVCAEERSTISADMEQLRLIEKYSDIDLVAGGRTFKAHKAILYTRSSYLAEILRDDDQQELVEVLKDVDGETFEELLSYIYSQKTKTYSFEMGLKLLPLSVKFKLEYLKLFLMDLLVGCMSVECALRLAMQAHEQHDTELKNCALECIGNNLEAALMHTKWQEFRSYEDLVDQLFHYVAKRFVRTKEVIENKTNQSIANNEFYV